jgi:hypothetical protein
MSLVFGCGHKAALYYPLRKMAGRKETKAIFMQKEIGGGGLPLFHRHDVSSSNPSETTPVCYR